MYKHLSEYTQNIFNIFPFFFVFMLRICYKASFKHFAYDGTRTVVPPLAYLSKPCIHLLAPSAPPSTFCSKGSSTAGSRLAVSS